MNKLDAIFADISSPAEYAREYSLYLCELLKNLDYQKVEEFIKLILDARENDQSIFFIGNGGSAATASHFANDIGLGTRAPGKPFRVQSLTDNNAVMTAIANDDGYENLFVLQLKNLLRPNDLVITISASGNSPNIVKALEYSKEVGAKTVSLCGFDGGISGKVSDLSILIETAKGEYGPVEDLHMILDHIVGTYLMRAVRV